MVSTPTTPDGLGSTYLLKYVHAARANKRIVMTQSDELLIPVFLAMHCILILTRPLRETVERSRTYA